MVSSWPITNKSLTCFNVQFKTEFSLCSSSCSNARDSDSSVTAGKVKHKLCMFVQCFTPRRQCSLFTVCCFIVCEQAKMMKGEYQSGNSNWERLWAVFNGKNYFTDRKAQNETKLRKINMFLSCALFAYTVEFVVLNACTLGSRQAGRHFCEKEYYFKTRTINN